MLLPKTLGQWFDSSPKQFEGFMHAIPGPRPAWLYARAFESAPLHGVCMELAPSAPTFWITLLMCPQLINIKLLRGHFSESTLSKWLLTGQVVDFVGMVAFPKSHIMSIVCWEYDPMKRGFGFSPLTSRYVDNFGLLTARIIGSIGMRVIGCSSAEGPPRWVKWLSMGYLFATSLTTFYDLYLFARLTWTCTLYHYRELTGNPLTLVEDQ